MDREKVSYSRISKIKLHDIIVATEKKRLWAIVDLEKGVVNYKVEEVGVDEWAFGHSLENAVDFYNTVGEKDDNVPKPRRRKVAASRTKAD